MDFEFSAEQEALRETVRRFLADKAPIAPYVRSMLDDPSGTTPEVWKGLADLGVTGLLVDEAHGGAGMGMLDMGVVLEEMGRAVHPGPFVSSAVGAVSLLAGAARIGDDDAGALLGSLASGDLVVAPAVLEPGRRGAWRDPRVNAESAGRGWRLQGVKEPVFDGAAAGILAVTASGPDGLGVWVVDADADGVAVEALAGVDGTRRAARVSFAGAPGRRAEGVGAEAVALAVDRTLVGWATDGVGAASAALDLAVAYAKERRQFDRPIGAFQAVQHLCTDMLQYVELARAGAYYALWACDSAPADERRRAATMAKAYAGESLVRVGAGVIQVFGGVGFTWEHDAHLFYKRLLTLQEAWGGSAEHLEELASLVIAAPTAR